MKYRFARPADGASEEAVATKPTNPWVGLPFEEGRAKGGAVLYEESEATFRGRVRDLKLAQFFFAFTFLAIGPLFLVMTAALAATGAASASLLYGLVPLLFGFTLGGFSLFVGAYLFKHALRIDRVLTPTRVYERGLSLGWFEAPFIPLDQIYSFESSYGQRRQTPYSVLTFRGGQYLSITKGMVKGSSRIKDYEELSACLAQRLKGVSPRDVSWDEDSLKVTSSLMSLKGPVRAKMERIALAGGRQSIDREFLRAHWGEVAREMVANPIPGFKWALAKAEEFDTLKRAAPVE